MNLYKFGLGGLLMLLLLVLTFLFFAPFVSIWALNTLFALSIPYTFNTWLAMFWVGLVLFPRKVN